MTAQVNYYKIGVLVLTAALIAVVLLILLGAGQFLHKKVVLETYFNESVQGLSVGAKVKYRGVVIGEVSRITFTLGTYEKNIPPSQRKRYVLVEANMRPELRVHDPRFASDGSVSPEEIANGLRIRLASQGITGVSYLEIDYVNPITNPVLPISWQPKHHYIPSAPSTTAQFMRSVESIFDRLQKLDIEGTLANWNRLVISTTDRINAVDTAQISARTTRLLERLDKVPLEQIGKDTAILIAQLKTVSSGLKQLINDPASQRPGDLNIAAQKLRAVLESPAFNRSVHHLAQSIERINRITARGESDLDNTVDNLQQITNNLRELTDIAKTYPAGVLFGRQPNRVEQDR